MSKSYIYRFNEDYNCCQLPAGTTIIGTITNSNFSENSGTECCGAIGSVSEDITIDNTTFTANSTEAMDTILPGGGALFLRFTLDGKITNSTFTEPSSEKPYIFIKRGINNF